MKSYILFAVAILSISSLQAQKRVKGNGHMTKITRTTPSYDAIKCSGSFDYVLVAGTEGNITIEGEENLLEYIVTKVEGNSLIIKVEDHMNLHTSSNKTIKITIPFKDINEVSLAGSGDLWNTDQITATDFKVSLAGSGDVSLDVKASSIKANLAGSGDIKLKGRTESLKAEVSGSGDIHGLELEADNVTVSIAGSGDVEVVCNQNLKATVSGSGNVKYKGNPKIEESKVSGSGKISQ